jgi:hypothetical protein
MRAVNARGLAREIYRRQPNGILFLFWFRGGVDSRVRVIPHVTTMLPQPARPDIDADAEAR